MPVTIKQIARVAGVCHSTVSRALRGNPVINANTTARIKKLADEMGYVPSAVALSLRSQKTFTIGMVVASIEDPFFGAVVEGAEDVANSADYRIILSNSHSEAVREMAVVDDLYRRRVDAIIVTSLWVDSINHEELKRIKIPIVLIDNQADGEYLSSIVVDNVEGGRMATEHLLGLGHRRIGFVGTPDQLRSSRERLLGYRQAFEAGGVPIEPNLLITPDLGDYEQRGKEALAPLREAGATAVFCYNDRTAVGLMAECRVQGIEVPKDLSIVGYDDLRLSRYVNPTLTTVHQPRVELGKRAMSMALDLLEGKEVGDVVLSCFLVKRESTAAPNVSHTEPVATGSRPIES